MTAARSRRQWPHYSRLPLSRATHYHMSVGAASALLGGCATRVTERPGPAAHSSRNGTTTSPDRTLAPGGIWSSWPFLAHGTTKSVITGLRRVAAALVCTAMAACAPSPGPEEAVRLWLQEAETAVEDRDRDGLMEMISERYTDARGNNRSDLDQMLRVLFLRNRNIVLVSKIDELTIIGETAAQVRLTAGMTGTSDSVLGLSADTYRFELELENDGDSWMLIGARWAELGGQLR